MKRKGFFPESTLRTKQPAYRVPRCESCKLYKSCNSPKMPVTGKGKKGILIVGEAPGKNEDEQGKQFVGDAGQALIQELRKCGINMRRDCWVTNAIVCHPKGNRTPTDKEISYCRPNLMKTIEEKQPHLILLFGATATKSLVQDLWKEKIGAMERWVGWQIPSQRLNAWICPNYHPSYVNRLSNTNQGKVLSLLFRSYLKQALQLETEPWEEIPDYRSEIHVMYDADKVVEEIKALMAFGAPITFDLETDRLKPDHPDARIVCCSVSNGQTTISFPWDGKSGGWMENLLNSDVPKYGWSIKFESRWIRKKTGIWVNNWQWDGMLGAHWEDNRRGITGLKFQSFVRLGFDSYNDAIEPYLKAKNSNERNRIDEIDLKQLLVYCGFDSLLEHKICQMQRGKMK